VGGLILNVFVSEVESELLNACEEVLWGSLRNGTRH
jgi:hypothetical protein